MNNLFPGRIFFCFVCILKQFSNEYEGFFPYAPNAILSWEFFLQFTWPGLCYVGNFSYTLCALLCGSFPYTPHPIFCWSFIHALYCVIWGIFLSLTHAMLFYVGSFFFYMPSAVLRGEFLLHTPCYSMWGVSHILVEFRCCTELLQLFFCGSISHKTRRLAKLFKAILLVSLVRKLLNSPRSDSCSLLQWKTCIPS